MFRLQFFNRSPNIPDLVRLGHLAVALQIDKGLPRPRRLEDVMAAAHPGLAEKLPADVQQVLEAHIFRVVKQAFIHTEMIAYSLSFFNYFFVFIFQIHEGLKPSPAIKIVYL